MKTIFTSLFFVFLLSCTLTSRAQTTLQTVDFETAGSGYTVTGAITPTSSACWERTDGTVISPDVAFTGKQGIYYFYGENTDSPANDKAPVYVTLSSVNVSGYNNFLVKLLGAGNNNALSGYEGDEYLRIQYSFDGGTFTTAAQFIPSFVAVNYLTEDANGDGTTDGANLSPAFTEFTYNISGTGTLLQIRIMANIDQGSEEVGFDNIRILGTVAASSPTVTTQAVSSIAATTATGNGNITSLGVPNPTAYGVCWNTTGTPTTSGSKVDKGAASATGAFTASMTELTAGTTYYVRAYATNTAGTSYGTEVNFTTSAATTNIFEDFESYSYSHWAHIASGSTWTNLKIYTEDMDIVFIHTADEGAGSGNGTKSISANGNSSSSWVSYTHKDRLPFTLNSMALSNPNHDWGSEYLTVRGYRNGVKVKEKTDVANLQHFIHRFLDKNNPYPLNCQILVGFFT